MTHPPGDWKGTQHISYGTNAVWSSIGQKFSHPLLPFPALPKLQCLCTYIWSGNSIVSSVLFCGARNGIVQTLKKPPVVHGAWWVGLLPVMKLFVFDWITYSDVQEEKLDHPRGGNGISKQRNGISHPKVPMMNFADPSTALLAASGGDTVKLFDVSVEPGDPCALSYSPSPGHQVNSVKWNHTNLVVASAGDDRKVSLWRKNGQSMGTIPVSGTDSGDNIEESILAISFSNKGSRYICSGGSGQVVRIWDLQRKRCIKWLRGHTDTITGAMYNCKDEHLASISLNGDLILHNLASGARAAELKDPNEQVSRVLDYSRISRHLLVTAGDDGSIHMWDTTGRSPKILILFWDGPVACVCVAVRCICTLYSGKQHPGKEIVFLHGISFQTKYTLLDILSLLPDGALFNLDVLMESVSWLKQHSAPTAGVSFSPSNDKIIATVGLDKKLYTFDTGSRRPSSCIPYEAPFSSLAFRDDGLILAAEQAVTSLCWQRSKPVIVNESNCTPETALLGGAVEDSILMPDPLPSVTSSSLSLSTAIPASRNPGRSGPSTETSSLTAASGGSVSSSLYLSTEEETPQKNHLRPGGTLARLHAPRSNYNFKDDMEAAKKDHLPVDKKPSSLLFPSSSRRFPFVDDGAIDHPIFDWKSSSTSRQDDTRASLSLLGSTPAPSSKSGEDSITPPEAWVVRDWSMLSGLQDLSVSTSQTSMSSLSNSNLGYANLRPKDVSSSQETSLGFSEHVPFSSISMSLGTKGVTGQTNLELPGPTSLNLPRRFSTYAERIGTTSSFSDGISLSMGSPKTKKSGAETREELLHSLLSRTDISTAMEPGILPSINGGTSQPQKAPIQTDSQQGNSFTLQLFQRTLDETLGSFQKSIHEDMKNLHIEILRQFHIQETDMSSVMSSILKNQVELMKEVQSLRKENQQLRQLL
ncbi:Protein NEDD1 [Vitis vinifera]|uniref:Protein NEDD1 n=1 Tax=Vitis vinifera TaxID=29760 RepID=A0A438JXK9_VITVI|nr:Protein NEDD1 [Vitis vinifera]